MKKSWVVIRNNKASALGQEGSIKAWRDYGDHAWGSALYEVLGYYTGSHRDAIEWGKEEFAQWCRDSGDPHFGDPESVEG